MTDQYISNKKPFKTNVEKMDYAKKSIGVRTGFQPASNHSILICEKYDVDEDRKQMTVEDWSKWYIGGTVKITNKGPWKWKEPRDIDDKTTVWRPVKRGNMLPKKGKQKDV